MHRVNQLHTASLRVAWRPKLEAEHNQRDYRPHHVWPRLATGKWTYVVWIWRFSQRCNWGGYCVIRGMTLRQWVNIFGGFEAHYCPQLQGSCFLIMESSVSFNFKMNRKISITQQSCQAVGILSIVLCVVYYATTWPITLGSLPAFSPESQNRPSFPDYLVAQHFSIPPPAPLISTRTPKNRSAFWNVVVVCVSIENMNRVWVD